MKTEQRFIGIDVSKDTLDICILSEQTHSYVIKNNKNSITKFFRTHLPKGTETLVCIENTGKYGWLLMELIPDMECKFYVVNPLHIKRSLGLVRGKNDKIDAIRIAKFIQKNEKETALYITPSLSLIHI